MSGPANYIFLPWTQPGVAANIPDSAVDKLNANQPGVVSLPVQLVVNTEPPISKTVRLYGPGDVTGIDPQQVARLEPRRGTSDFEPNYFPSIEFDRPDFPWLFTPAKSDAQGRLRPWLCLVVVRKQDGVALRSTGAVLVLEIKAPAVPGNELPDLLESWAWAHAQVTGSAKDQLQNTLAGDPARSVSRLLCPRRLDPSTEYLACVVPAFDLGVKAGLNQPLPATNKLDPAWQSGAQSPSQITLPVYFHWDFRTGVGGDFEELARKLVARMVPPEVGKRPMDVSRPGFNSQPPQDGTGARLGLEGALRPVKGKSDDWPDSARLPFQTELEKILNTPWQVTNGNAPGQDPIVAPPIYGCWQAAAQQVGVGNPPAPPQTWPPTFWLNELNLDPRTRVAAAAGTQVIQEEQEQLMASAWEQLGEIEKINQRLRQAQLSRAVNSVYHAKSFSRFSGETFLKIVAPAQSRIVLSERPANLPPTTPPTKMLLTQKIATSFVPSEVVSAPLRKMARPRGAINQPYARTGAAGIGSLIDHFNAVSVFGPLVQPFAGGETIWVDDSTPAGAVLAGDNESWSWTSTPAPYTGSRCHQSIISAGLHQHYFYNATTTLDVGEGDKLFVYIFVDQANLPSEVMLQWHSGGSWEHRAYWGANNIGWGADGTVARRKIGALPIANGWVRLEVAAADVGLEGLKVDGMAFTLFGGRAYWDRAGKLLATDKGAVTIGRVSDMLPAGGGFVWNPTPPAHWERASAAAIRMHDNFRLQNLSASVINAKQSTFSNADLFRAPAAAHQEYLGQMFSSIVLRDIRAELVAQSIQAAALVGMDPNTTVSARALSGFSITSPPLKSGDPIDPIMDAPAFPQPMYEALRDLSQDYLLPGLEDVPANTVTTLETNNKFIESFLVGLNAEMSRELLWRGYPTDQRGTYFQTFWEAVGPQTAPDIPPINQWNANALGKNVTGAAAGGNLVLLIRGDLLRRYPNTVIYAVKAVRINGVRDLSPDANDEKHPIFRGTLEPDVTFLGFNLDSDQAIADPGWFFVIQQQPTEPRFGLDEAPFEDPAGDQTIPELKTWDNLNWAHLAKDEATLKALSHVSVTKIQLTTTQSDKGVWGRNAAHMAYITKQLPTRVAIHASEMIPTPEKPNP